MNNFWNDFTKPIMALAPMEEVTDTVFRRLIADISGAGRPDVMFTEFTSCEGVQSVGQAQVIKRLRYHECERPLVAQVWGITPEDYYKTAQLVVELGFDGIDINMGCPVKKIIKNGACSALIKTPTLAKEIVQASREGLAGKIPLSIKTRIGFSMIQTEEWCGFLLSECRPDALTVHGRTVKEASKVPNHWDEVGKVVKLRDELQKNDIGYTKSMSGEQGLNPEDGDDALSGSKQSTQDPYSASKTLIIGNGDVTSLPQAQSLIQEYNLDGIMVGRGVFQNPWIFNPQSEYDNGRIYLDGQELDLTYRLNILKKHVQMYEEEWGDTKNFGVLKRFFKIYIHGLRGAADIRAQFMQTHSYQEVYDLISQIIDVD
jgi:tRNA-dihydrouridine synthase